MKTLHLTFLFFLVFSYSHAQTNDRIKGIETLIEKVLESTKTPGCAIAIVEGEHILYANGIGFRDIENKLKVDANTLFPIGSNTKTFTAALLGIYRDKKLLSFDEHPSKYIPNLKFYTDDLNSNLTIQDILGMRSGLALHDAAWSGLPLDDRNLLINRIKFLQPTSKLREKWNYSNWSYLLAGAIGENITKQSWEENVKESLFKPLQMNRSNFGVPGLLSDQNVSLGYQVIDNDPNKVDYREISAMRPAGAINSSATDMANWILTWVNNGKFNDREILPKNYISEAIYPQTVMPTGYLPDEEYNGIYSANYGYGWIVTNYQGHYRVEHGGSIDGFRSTVVFFPNEKIGIVVLTNQSDYEPALIIRNILSDRMLGLKDRKWLDEYQQRLEPIKSASTVSNKFVKAKTKTSVPKLPYDISGKYLNGGYGQLDIFMEGKAYYTIFRNRKLRIIHKENNVFHAVRVDAPDRMGMPALHFKRDENGLSNLLFVKFESELEPIRFERQ
ncbi:serine hydrolase domain-containing protein [Adhaeribacter aquaticus]|uniref:serine hydrolase domain-containing protein n=1 Tax=Adhaeribacter aquaticus TaxID=299567 RepID=UPI000413E008|nr:serine hydrolase domain-containing protein [Adhaeribacter aquaticus]